MAREPLRLAHPGLPREVDRYLVPTEKVIFSTRLHVFYLTEPIVSAVGGLILLGILESRISGNSSGSGLAADALVVLWVAVAVRSLWKLLQWYRTIFLSTDRRLVLVNGIVVRKVSMMPLGKVTDMRYDRTPFGQIIGYGKFVLESAGQDQALSTINFVPQPDMHYRQINEVLFSPTGGRSGVRVPPSARALPVQEPNEAWWRRR